MKVRKWNNIFHRDLGYIFAGMTVIYAISGIALNHMDDWNPSYIIDQEQIVLDVPLQKSAVNEAEAKSILQQSGIDLQFKKHYFPNPNTLKIFFKGGSATINISTGQGIIEQVKKRQVFYQFNFLHYNNPKKLWTWFSDIFCAALIILTITGLFVLKGEKGIKGRGAWLTGIGIIIPLLFILTYL